MKSNVYVVQSQHLPKPCGWEEQTFEGCYLNEASAKLFCELYSTPEIEYNYFETELLGILKDKQ